jgi:hypothetical protein
MNAMHDPEPLPRRLLAEALGSDLLAATVVGSGIMAERLSGGNMAVAWQSNFDRGTAVAKYLESIRCSQSPDPDDRPWKRDHQDCL